MSKQGFIMLHRSIQQHWIYDEKRKFSKYEAWLDLLMLVNYKDNKVLQDGVLVEVKRGERITSIRQLMDRWGWSNTKVVNFLDLLKSDNMIDYEVTPKKKTIIRVMNYGYYQGLPEIEQSEKKTPETQQHQGFGEGEQSEKKTPDFSDDEKKDKKTITEKTPEIQSYQGIGEGNDFKNNHRPITETTQNNINNKDNKDNKKDINNSSHRFTNDDMENAKYLFELMQQNNPGAKQPNFDKWANDFRLMRERDKRTDKQIKYLIEWTQNDSFWRSNILSPAKLRKQWDQLVLKVQSEHEKRQVKKTNGDTLSQLQQFKELNGHGNQPNGIDHTVSRNLLP